MDKETEAERSLGEVGMSIVQLREGKAGIPPTRISLPCDL